ncbi:xylosyltransferase 1 [Nephila pilipes]|uniref:protein xylosyltransferase n=1 Tax=Nephila pilipes TaxID=299642 RepID=A0A8X6N4G1_NEPPI|nr:xylosyltransferase 1 [Nephila pilipes]
MNFITLILVFVHGFLAEDIYLPDGRLFNLPKPEDYPYFINDEYPSSLERLYFLSYEHADAFLSCPKGYSMLEMSQELVVDHIFNGSISKGIAKHHTASLLESNRNGHTFNSPCPVIYDCLGYQSCLFVFNRHFCPDLKILPFMLLNIVCHRDGFVAVPAKFKKQKDLVLHIYEHFMLDHDMQNLEHHELSEELVFGGHCSSPNIAMQTEGFFGSCSHNPSSKNNIIQDLWPTLGQTITHNCQDQLMQVYCAFQYNKQGFCLPSVYHNKNNNTDQNFSYSVLPKVGQQLKNNHLASKRAPFNAHIRLAFMIMVFNNSKSTMELISSIYREDFFYVIHADRQNSNIKKELNQLIIQLNLPIHNILILPDEKSFITPKASYETVRAQLEGFVALLRFGFWDFLINLSENDIPLRNVDDLAIALTPYRGSSFLSSLQLSVNDGDKESFEEFVFSSCDGFVYKVSSKGTLSTSSKFKVFRAPRGGAFSREFIHYLVNEKMRSSMINDYQLYLQTDVMPDESYIPTVLMNSQFRDSVYLAPIHNTMLFSNDNFLSYFYTCKQHSKIECSYIDELLSMSHNSFFVSFPFQPAPEVKVFAFGLAKDDYYQFLMKYLPPKLLKILIDDALERFCTKAKLPVDSLSLESILKLYITPCLVPLDTCCISKFITSYSKIADVSYWIDINLFNRTSEKYFDTRLMLQPVLGSRFCFGDGDLRMVFISPWIGHLNLSKPQWSRYNLEIFSPLPYGPAYTDDVLIHLLFSDEAGNAHCKSDHKSNSIDDPLKFKSQTDSIKINLLLISPNHEKKCSTDVILFQENKKNETKTSQTKGYISMNSILMPCKNMEPGHWTLQLYQVEPTKSRKYTFPLYLVDLDDKDYLNNHLKEIAHLWELKYFAFMNKNDPSDFHKSEMIYTSLSSQHFSHISGQKEINIVKTHNSKKDRRLIGNRFHHWYICGGGFASTFILCLIFVLFFFKKYFRLNLLWVYILSLILVVFLQIMLFFTLCEQ